MNRQVVDERTKRARHLFARNLVVLGGDCLVDLTPFAYLNERYDADLAVLWIDTHPDVSTPAQYPHAHAMVLSQLMGHGDRDFAKLVKMPVPAKNVLIAGLHDPFEWEAGEAKRLGISTVSPEALATHGSTPVLQWFQSTGAKNLAVHFDLDALDPTGFRSVLFAKPGGLPKSMDSVAQGQLSMASVIRILKDVAKVANIVGLGIAEHLPWDALAMRDMLSELPLLGD